MVNEAWLIRVKHKDETLCEEHTELLDLYPYTDLSFRLMLLREPLGSLERYSRYTHVVPREEW